MNDNTCGADLTSNWRRRNFLRASVATLLNAHMLPVAFAQSAASPMLRPRRLEVGDRVAMVAPSGVLHAAGIERSFANLGSLGLKPFLSANARAQNGTYAGTVQERVADLHAAFADPTVKAIWPVRGGSGSAALLPHLDYALIARNPKIVIGYSDTTALHLALLRNARLVSFHGPVAGSTFTPFSLANLKRVLFDPAPNAIFAMPDEWTHTTRTPNATGRAEGMLVGGNLSVLTSLIGTPFAPQIKDALLFLEDVSEAPYRIDRMLTQLDQSLGLANAAAVLCGVFEKATPTDDGPSSTLEQVIDSHLATLRAPAAYGLPFGHINQQWTLPLGVRARIDTAARTLTLLEPTTT